MRGPLVGPVKARPSMTVEAAPSLDANRFMLENLLRHIEFLDDAIATFDRHVERLTAPQADALARLDTIPGVAVGGRLTSMTLAGIGRPRDEGAGGTVRAAW
jgi:hypothetical protein